MEQARNYVCRSCSTPVPTGHKFCGRCGDGRAARDPQRADAVLRGHAEPGEGEAHPDPRRGDGRALVPPQGRAAHRRAQRAARVPGRSVRLAEARELLLPRRQARRARRGLAQRRVHPRARHRRHRRRATPSSPASSSSASTRRPRASDGPDPDGTYFYSSPKHPSPFRLTQILQGGAHRHDGVRARQRRCRSAAKAATSTSRATSTCRARTAASRSTAASSRSPTSTAATAPTCASRAERELAHGDYLFIGRKLLRVELNTN